MAGNSAPVEPVCRDHIEHVEGVLRDDIAHVEPRTDDGTLSRLRSLTDEELLRQLCELLRQSRRVESELVAHIGEVDERRLYARAAVDSMFAYCTDVLHLSEHEAYLRITVARAAREHPVLLAMLADGRLHLSGIAKLVPRLTSANRDAILARAVHKSKREIGELVALLAPHEDVPAAIRKLPEPRRAESQTPAPPATLRVTPELGLDRVPAVARPASIRPAVVHPLAPGRYLVQFTASARFRDTLQRLTALMRTSVPDGDLATILEQAVEEKVERLEARRYGKTRAPRKGLAETQTTASSSRYIPAPVRRAVHDRDGGRCRYVDDQGRRCRVRQRLEFHHVHAHARGGGRSPDNLRLMCRTHNAYLAEEEYGTDTMAKYRRAAATRNVPLSPS